jgi:hypothetical protein
MNDAGNKLVDPGLVLLVSYRRHPFLIKSV